MDHQAALEEQMRLIEEQRRLMHRIDLSYIQYASAKLARDEDIKLACMVTLLAALLLVLVYVIGSRHWQEYPPWHQQRPRPRQRDRSHGEPDHAAN